MTATPVIQGAPLPLVVRVTEDRRAGELIRTMELGTQSVYFRLTGESLPPPLVTWDFAAIASIYTAMRLGRPLHIAGPVSRSLLANLEEFQLAWHRWLPKQYAIVPLSADEEREASADSGTQQKGVFAFSGGVDSTYSVLLHARRAAGRQTVAPAVAAMVHGFDIALGDRTGFAGAAGSARAMLDDVGVPLVEVETNWRDVLCHNWRMEHMAGIAAALNQFQGMAGVAVVGGDEGYDELDIPWGSNLVTNPLLGGDGMRFRTEGAGFSRSERLDFILGHSDLAPRLRVCWENSHTGGNCGVCEKCISTQLNFRALGREPEGFRHIASFARIAMIPIRSKGDLYYLLEQQRVARARGVRGWWRAAAGIAILRSLMHRPLLLLKDALKARIRLNAPLYERLKRLVRTHA